jgi:hypothetical protein
MQITMDQYKEFENDGILILPGKIEAEDDQREVVLELGRRYIDWCNSEDVCVGNVAINVKFSFNNNGDTTFVHNEGKVNREVN